MSFSAQNFFWVLSLNLILCSCVQKMGILGHLQPMGDDPPFSMTTRQPPESTVPQEENTPPPAVAPIRMTSMLLQTGREQFNIYCMPCHGMSGQGNGMIVQRGFLAPPSYHIDRLRNAPDQHFFNVITQGYGAMYSYGDRVNPQDRWAIVAYIRALQLSQNFPNLPQTHPNATPSSQESNP